MSQLQPKGSDTSTIATGTGGYHLSRLMGNKVQVGIMVCGGESKASQGVWQQWIFFEVFLL